MQAEADEGFHQREIVHGEPRDALCEWRIAQSAETLYQGAGIDVDRAGGGAHAVGGAGIERHVRKIAFELDE